MSIKSTEDALWVELRAVFVEVFHVPETEIAAKTQFGDMPQWDSMGHMDLMVALETKYGIEISADTISQLVSVPAIIDHIQTKQNG